MEDLRARISFQQDIRDCNILCLTETWLTASVPDSALRPSDNFSVLWMDRTAEAGKTKGGGVCFMITRNGVTPGISPFCRIPARLIWNISPLSAAHSICPGSFHQSSLLPFTFHHRQTLAWLCPNSTMSSAATSINTLTLPLSSRGTLTKPTSRRSCRTFTNTYPVQLEDRIHWIIATLSLRMPTKFVPCWLLAIRTMPPFSSHQNINKRSSGAPGGEGSDVLVLPL